MSEIRISNYRPHADGRDEATLPSAVPAATRLLAPATPGVWFWPGSQVRMKALFSDPSSTIAPTDAYGYGIVSPSTVACTLTLPDGSTATGSTPTQSADGSYQSDVFPVSMPGTWWFKFVASGTYSAVIESFFQVRQPRA